MSGTVMVFLTAFVPRLLLAALKVAVGIALVCFGKRYEQDKKERRYNRRSFCVSGINST